MILTFEKIRELQWNEKNSKNLQELPKNFFQDLREYLARTKDSYSRFVIEDLIDMRIRKMLNFAINYFKTKEIPKNMTEEERALFDSILNYVSEFRKKCMESDLHFEEKNIINEGLEKEFKKINVVIVEKDIGPFVGTDLNIYNLKRGEKVILPEDLKNLLIKYGYCKIEE
ncbi:MAG: hypothetical protein QXJ28_00065 [Candidatus Pacearchaeota archaeon]